MKTQPNAEIRETIRNHNLHKYEVAYKVGIAETTFSVWLRKELTGERKEKVLRAIKELTEND